MPCWSQRRETETNEERQEVKERERQKQIERKIPVGCAALSLSKLVKFPEEDYTQNRNMYCVLVPLFLKKISSLPSYCTRSLLSQEGGGHEEEEEGEEGVHCGSAEPLFQSS